MRYHEYNGKYIPMSYLFSACKDKTPERVAFSDIEWKGKTKRFDVDISEPIILAEGISKKKYHMCDGRHRTTKMLSLGKESIMAYIISKGEFIKGLQGEMVRQSLQSII